ncbi:type II toxin-antitoxin system YoeB family toxin [Prauserella sediminis]|uniref:type II toxin-antitoxin system YoeB family toxin n=1 Tax=Prauserella sediminis TaxID=577680 RepID=UPI002B4666AB|nr:type II toxin-antitoxin system YoeB family toxin [Prauserella sediminis]
MDACLQESFSGIGKPEQLKYGAQGSWSRRITDAHRLVCPVDGEDLVILQAASTIEPGCPYAWARG